MKARFFTFGDRKYVNNAIATWDVLDNIRHTFGRVRDFSIKFKKPILSNAELTFSTNPIDGNFIGQFDTGSGIIYFSYMPIDEQLQLKSLSVDDIQDEITLLSLCYYIAEKTHQRILSAFENIYGLRTSTDKSIFVKYDITDTDILHNVINKGTIPVLHITDPELIGDRRFKLAVHLDNRLLGYRYNTVKEFKL